MMKERLEMKRSYLGEKHQRFSLRKVSVGLVSALVGVFYLFSGVGSLASVAASEQTPSVTKQIHYKYVTESELTDQEKQLVVKELPQFAEETDDTYYLIYRPTRQLPATGHSQLISSIAAGAGIVLLVVAIKLGRDDRKKLASFMLLTSLGSQLIAPTSLALTNQMLADYNQELTVQVGETLQSPLTIEGYQYVGYLKSQKEVNSPVDGKKELNHSAPIDTPVQTSNGSQAQEEYRAQKPSDAPVFEQPELKVDSKDTSRTEIIPFQVEEVEAADLPQGQTEVIQAGKNGSRTIVTRNYFLNGQVIHTEEVSNQVMTEPTSEIRKVGIKVLSPTKPSPGESVSEKPTDAPVHEVPSLNVEEKDVTTTVAEPYTRERVESDSLPVGQTKITQAGQDGVRTIVTRQYMVDGKVERSQELSNEVTTPAVSEIVTVGTGPVSEKPTDAPINEVPSLNVEEKDVTTTVAEPYTRERVESDSLPVGQTKITQAGQDGVRTIVTRQYIVDGKVERSQEISNEVTTPAVSEIVTVGTAPVSEKPTDAPVNEVPNLNVEEKDVTTTVAEPYPTKEVESADLPLGQREVSQAGQEGVRTIVTRQYLVDGKVENTEEISNTITKEAVPQIIKVGTKPISTNADHAPVEPEKGTLDLEPLHQLVEEADSIQKTHQYFNDTTADQESYKQAVANAQALFETSHASQEQVDSLKKALETAKNNLDGQPVDKKTLGVEFDMKDVTQSTVAYQYADEQAKLRYRRALDQAKLVLDNPFANQALVDQVRTDLEAARQALDGVKRKPTLSLVSVEKEEDKRQVSLSYHLTDATASYQSAKVQLYKGETLIKEVDLVDLTQKLTLDDLDYYTPYTLKTVMKYDLGQGEQTSIEDQRPVQLDYKKVEIKDIDRIELYGKDGSHYRRYLSLSEVPSDLDNYYVRIQSDKFKDMLLPVSKITDKGNAYSVTVSANQLVEGEGDRYRPDYSFELPKTPLSQEGVYTSFKTLIEAMKSNPTGNFKLGANVSADEIQLEQSATSYVPEEFSGSLTSRVDGKDYTIYNLEKPLFATLKNATIQQLTLKSAAVTGKDSIGSLASNAQNATITDVSVSGSLSGNKHIGGLVGVAQNTKLTNVAFKGSITSTQDGGQEYNIGGLVGNFHGNQSLTQKSQADVSIQVTGRNGDQRVGGLIGRLQNGARLETSYVSGSIQNGGHSGQVGGAIGSTWNNGQVRNVLTGVKVQNGHAMTGDPYPEASVRDSYVLEGTTANRKDERFVRSISEADAQAKRQSFGITSNLTDQEPLQQTYQHQTDYSRVRGAQESRKQAYENVEKLLPFYNKDFIVHTANQLAEDDKLNKVALLDVVPMKDGTLITDVNSHKGEINRLMLHYADKTIAYLDLTYKGDFANGQIAEYSIADKNLLYTPEAFLSDYQTIKESVLDELKAVTYDSAAVRKVLGIGETASLDDLYLEKAFEQIKAELGQELLKVLSVDKSINTLGPAVADAISQKILQNKEAFMLGLTYLNRWYNVNYGTFNTKDLNAYKFDFFGNQAASTLDTIIALGNSGMGNLRSQNNFNAYRQSLAKEKGKGDLFAYLESLRELFLPNKTNSEWFKENTKAYIVEARSSLPEIQAKQDNADRKSKYTIKVYDRLTQGDWGFKQMVLQLLTLPERDVYIISNMSTIAFGSFGGYRKEGGRVLSGEELHRHVEKLVDQSAEWQRNHYDMWYNILSPNRKDTLFRRVIVTDGFFLYNDKGQQYWAPRNDKTSVAMYNFFGPAGKYHGDNGLGAFANGYEVFYVYDQMLGASGTMVYTHEMTHNSDGSIYFEGHGRREGEGPESFATGMLESVTNVSEKGLVLNSFYQGDKDSTTRYHTYDPVARFSSADALRDYMHGVFDVLNLLDYVEGDIVTGVLTDQQKMKWYRKAENYNFEKTSYGKQAHADDRIVPITAEEAAKLKSVDALVDHNIIGRRDGWDRASFGRNGYYVINMFATFYAALDNPTGAPGGLMFRRRAYELLGDKGYQQGFVPYVSGQYAGQALKEGDKTYSTWNRGDVGVVGDDRILKNLYGSQYESWKDLKKAMLNERYNKAQTFLRPITIEFEAGKLDSKRQITISSYEELQDYMYLAVLADASAKNIDRALSDSSKSSVAQLKYRIFNAYLRATDDFRQSIFER
nr:G5 domain-containing protein [Streptococcus oralis]